MKVIAALFCLFLSVNALAQSKPVKTDTAQLYAIIDPPSTGKTGKPLIVVNEVIYTGNIRQIDPDDILAINVMNPPGSVALYGEQGKNGVVKITTKPRPVANKPLDIAPVDSVKDKNTTYVIDGEISKNKLDGVDTNDIIGINVLRDASPDPSMRVSGNGVTISVTTKKYAVKSYQEKLSYVSMKYKLYLKAHQNNDDDCGYLLNGEPVTGIDKKQIINKLYDIPADKIKTVLFMENPTFNGGDSKKEIVIITTVE